MKLPEIVYEDYDLLVVNKPAGLVCHPTKHDGFSSLISQVRSYVGAGGFPHLVNRLDRETSGIVVVAKGREPALRLRRIWEMGGVRKEYQAIVHGRVVEDHALIDAPLGRDESSPIAIKNCVRQDGAVAQTEIRVADRFRRDAREFTLLRVIPWTGRKHQIRIHLAYYGHPIVGDKLYGADERFYLSFVKGELSANERQTLILPYHALHAREVRFPWRHGEMLFQARPERWFTGFLSIPGKSAAA